MACSVLHILDILKYVSDKIGLKSFYYGHIEDLVSFINSNNSANIPILPALFLPMDLRYSHTFLNEFKIKLDVLIAINSSNGMSSEKRFLTTMQELDVLREKFEYELSKRVVIIENIGGVLRPKVANSWNTNNKGKTIFNSDMDGIEIICDITYNATIPCLSYELKHINTPDYVIHYL